MTLVDAPVQLGATAVARWRNDLVGVHLLGRAHWRTKISYYRAVAELLDGRPHTKIRWRDVVDHVVPRGSRTTFYDVTGPNAKYPMVGVLARSGDPELMQLAWIYRRDDPVAQLIDEAKVWSYWLYRDLLIERMRRAGDAEPLLRRSLMDWAADYPELAAASHGAPPACVVEDLVAIRHGCLAAVRAHDMLTAVVEETLHTTDGV